MTGLSSGKTEALNTNEAREVATRVNGGRSHIAENQEIFLNIEVPLGPCVEIYGLVGVLRNDGRSLRFVTNISDPLPANAFQAYGGVYPLHGKNNPSIGSIGKRVVKARVRIFNSGNKAIHAGKGVVCTDKGTSSEYHDTVRPRSGCKVMLVKEASPDMITALSGHLSTYVAATTYDIVGAPAADATDASLDLEKRVLKAAHLMVTTAAAASETDATKPSAAIYNQVLLELYEATFVSFATAAEDIAAGGWGLVDLHKFG